jgi:hypothetical protein
LQSKQSFNTSTILNEEQRGGEERYRNICGRVALRGLCLSPVFLSKLAKHLAVFVCLGIVAETSSRLGRKDYARL